MLWPGSPDSLGRLGEPAPTFFGWCYAAATVLLKYSGQRRPPSCRAGASPARDGAVPGRRSARPTTGTYRLRHFLICSAERSKKICCHLPFPRRRPPSCRAGAPPARDGAVPGRRSARPTTGTYRLPTFSEWYCGRSACQGWRCARQAERPPYNRNLPATTFCNLLQLASLSGRLPRRSVPRCRGQPSHGRSASPWSLRSSIPRCSHLSAPTFSDRRRRT